MIPIRCFWEGPSFPGAGPRNQALHCRIPVCWVRTGSSAQTSHAFAKDSDRLVMECVSRAFSKKLSVARATLTGSWFDRWLVDRSPVYRVPAPRGLMAGMSFLGECRDRHLCQTIARLQALGSAVPGEGPPHPWEQWASVPGGCTGCMETPDRRRRPGSLSLGQKHKISVGEPTKTR